MDDRIFEGWKDIPGWEAGFVSKGIPKSEADFAAEEHYSLEGRRDRLAAAREPEDGERRKSGPVTRPGGVQRMRSRWRLLFAALFPLAEALLIPGDGKVYSKDTKVLAVRVLSGSSLEAAVLAPFPRSIKELSL
jgi:hypothetical protein